jgi:hypothetical protein
MFKLTCFLRLTDSNFPWYPTYEICTLLFDVIFHLKFFKCTNLRSKFRYIIGHNMHYTYNRFLTKKEHFNLFVIAN